MATKFTTIVAFIGELIDTHMAACSAENPNDDIPHIISETHKTKASIVTSGVFTSPWDATIYLVLDDGTRWNVSISEAVR